VELKLERSTLRPFRRDDEPSLVRYADNRNVSRNMRDRFPYPYTAADAREWVARVSGQSPVANFAIVVDGAAVGGIGLEPGPTSSAARPRSATGSASRSGDAASPPRPCGR
jgi:RimJ/RimL family protein N-acetyltransferase